MENIKNLVEEFILEEKIIDPDKFMYNFMHEDVEWFVYKLSDNDIRYISYELTPHGLGYAFCVTIKCTRLSYNICSLFFTKSFSNSSKGEWKDIPAELEKKLISDAMRDLQVWKK